MTVRVSAALVLCAAMTVAACGKKKVETPPPAAATPAPAATPTRTPPPPPPPAPPAERTPAPLTEDEIFAKKTLEDLNREAPLEDVYFDYDSIELSDAARASLQKNLKYLQRWTSTRFVVEGHADSRGTNEYNFALADRRAAAVRDYLVSLGLAAERATTVSKGEESPACEEETAACWQKNRRGHFIFTAK